jgi:hypothetical protein
MDKTWKTAKNWNVRPSIVVLSAFFNDTATTEIYTTVFEY